MKTFCRVACVLLFVSGYLISNDAFGQGVFSSSGAGGSWSSSAEWTLDSGTDGDGVPDSDDDVTITNGNDILVDVDSEVGNITINSGATLTNGTNDQLTVYGNYTNNGDQTGGNASSKLLLVGTGKIIDGSGTAGPTGNIVIQGTYTIAGTSTITFTDNLWIENDLTIASGADIDSDVQTYLNGPGITVTNNGIFTDAITNTLSNTDADAVWVNAAGSTYIQRDNSKPFPSNGTFDCSAAGNTYKMVNGGSLNAFQLGANYQNLVISNTSAVSLGESIIVDGNLTVDAGSSLNANGRDMTAKGNLDFQGDFNPNLYTLFLTGTADQSISSAAGETFYGLTINKPSGDVNLSTPIIISNALTLTQGVINTTATNLLTVADGATSTSGDADSYVDGPMKKIGNAAFTFPLGSGPYWSRLAISAPGSATDAFTAQYFTTAYGDLTVSGLNNVSSGEYWTLDRTVGTSNVTVQLFWESATNSDISDYSTDLVVAHYTDPDWVTAGHSAVTASSPGSVTSNTVSSFSPFTFGSVSGGSGLVTVLPIELLRFEVGQMDGETRISWATISELNNDFFTIEHSVDGTNFQGVGTMKGAGTSNEEIEYEWFDQLLIGMNYYRLKQTDFDGQFTYSETVGLDNQNIAGSSFKVYPNPAVQWQNINVITRASGSENSDVLIVLVDAMGRQVYTKGFIGSSQSDDILTILPQKDLIPGVYFLIGTTGDLKFNQKVIIR